MAGLNRELEYLPTEKAIAARRSARRGLVAPELATVMAYTKIHLYEALLESDLPEDPYLGSRPRALLPRSAARALPRARCTVTGCAARSSPPWSPTSSSIAPAPPSPSGSPRRPGASASQLARAYAVAREVFEMRDFWAAVEALDNQIEAGTQLAMLIEGRRLVERATRWLVRAHPRALDIEATTERFLPGARLLAPALPERARGPDREAFAARHDELPEAGVPDPLARRVASMQALLSVFDIVEDAAGTGRAPGAGDGRLLRARGAAGARLAARPDPRAAAGRSLAGAGAGGAARRPLPAAPGADPRRPAVRVDARDGSRRRRSAAGASATRPASSAPLSVLADVKASGSYDTTTLPVALRELGNLVRPPSRRRPV